MYRGAWDRANGLPDRLLDSVQYLPLELFRGFVEHDFGVEGQPQVRWPTRRRTLLMLVHGAPLDISWIFDAVSGEDVLEGPEPIQGHRGVGTAPVASFVFEDVGRQAPKPKFGIERALGRFIHRAMMPARRFRL
jgi:hypothetical protein